MFEFVIGRNEAISNALRVTVKYIQREIIIKIGGAGPVSNSPGLQIRDDERTARTWSYGGKVYFNLPAAADVSIHTLSGTLYDSRRLPAGDSSIALPPGFYIVRVPGITETKIVIN